jgi:hypothetical protein
VRVEVSADAGRTWQVAELGEGSQQPLNRAWAWTFWSAALALPSDLQGSATQVPPTIHTLHTTHYTHTHPVSCASERAAGCRYAGPPHTTHTTHYTHIHTHTHLLSCASERAAGCPYAGPHTTHTTHASYTSILRPRALVG